MNKQTLLTLAGLLLASTASAQDTYLSCDFSEGIPEDFTLIDVDGREPSTDMKALGFEIGIPWIMTHIDKEENAVACSTSWYKNAGTSDDWMITSPLKISSEKAVLTWRAKTRDKDYRDGYAIYVSEKGNALEDFDTANPIYSIKAEQYEWVEHSISLEAYNGKTIYIAFVNNSKDKTALYVDDLFVGVPSNVNFTLDMPRTISQWGDVTVRGKAFTTSDKAVEGFEIGFEYDGELITQQFDVTLQPGESYDFALNTPMHIQRNQTLEYSAWIASGEDRVETSGKVSSYRQSVVAEEVTGTWCGYCVRGIVAMNTMKEKYPDSFIGIAIHMGSDGWADPMEYADYCNYIMTSMGMGGFPHATVNRDLRYTGDPANIPTYYETIIKADTKVGMDVDVDYDNSSRALSATTNLYFINDETDTDYRLGYVIIENNVHKEGNPAMDEYCQNNYYSGGSMGEMGGFEDLPATVPGSSMYYQDVARYVSGDFAGIEGSVPTEISEGEKITYEHSFTLPDNIMNDLETELVVLLINNKSGQIVNGEKVNLKGVISSVNSVSEATPDCYVTCENGNIRISSDKVIEDVQIYDMNGRMVYTDNSVNTSSYTVPSVQGKGIYAVRITIDGKTTVRKIII